MKSPLLCHRARGACGGSVPRASRLVVLANTPHSPYVLPLFNLVSATAAWALTENALVRTQDGGLHWVVVETPQGQLVGMDFVDANDVGSGSRHRARSRSAIR